MKGIFTPLVLGVALLLAACASRPEVRPTVGDRDLLPREISPGDTLEVSFSLEVEDPTAVTRVYLRGLPKNTLIAGTQTELALPERQKTSYKLPIQVQVPAADGHYNLELVFETTGKTYVAQLGALAIRDTPSRILYSQFLPGSHDVEDCAIGTKLLTFEYAVADDNGAADFVAPTLLPIDKGSNDFVFFPHWEPITWLGGKPGIVLAPPSESAAQQQLVTSDIRIHCDMARATLYQYEIKGQSVSRLTGKSTNTGGDPARYYVK